MLELLLSGKGQSAPIGVQYNGIVPATSLITGSALWAAIGAGGGTAFNDTEGWLSFVLDGKTLLVAKKAFRYSVTWASIYNAGAVYGRDDTGPAGLSYTGLTLAAQNKRVTINGITYKVRLLTGSNTNPAPNTTGDALTTTAASEWDRLMYAVAASRPAIYTGPILDNLSDLDLGIVSKDAGEGNGGYTWCVEQHGYGATYRVCRGFYDVGFVYRETVGLVNIGWGWRPVLEAV